MSMMIHWDGEQEEIWAKDWDFYRFLRRFPHMGSVVEPMRGLLPDRANYLVDMIVKDHIPGDSPPGRCLRCSRKEGVPEGIGYGHDQGEEFRGEKMKYKKMVDLKRAMGGIVKNEELVRALFEEIPDLKTFSWTKTQEYDYNNYFVSTRVVSINGHDYGYDGYEEDDEEDCGLPKVTATHMVEDVMDQISDSYDLSDGVWVMDRDDYFLES